MKLQKGQNSSHPTWGRGSQKPYSVESGLPSPKHFSQLQYLHLFEALFGGSTPLRTEILGSLHLT